ncbi:MAG: alpha/beta hydrolase family protein [Candidatus Heimdallarchaeaceae archaeon]
MKKIAYDIAYRKETLHGILYIPDGDGPFPLVIRLNGMPGLSPEEEEKRLADIIVNNGFVFYAFDYVGVRQSSGVFDYYSCINNINTVITTLSHHPLVDPSRIALIGESFGGAMAISQGVRDRRIKCMVLRSPVFDTEEIPRIPSFETLTKIWIRNKQVRFPKGNISELYSKQTELYNPERLAKFLNCPVKLIVGDKDELLEFNGFERLYEMIPEQSRKGLEVVPGADHNFTNQSKLEWLKKAIVNFLATCL